MRRRRLRTHLTAYLFLLPGLALLTLWLVVPMVSALNISLRDWNILPGTRSPFIGLENYLRASHDAAFWRALANTGQFAVVTVAGQLLLGLTAALMIDALPVGRVFFRTLYYLPVVTSWVVVSLLFKFLFNASQSGLVNYVLVNVLHVVAEPVRWLTEASTAFVVIDALGIWKGVGFAMIIFLAALQTIPPELFQVAAIDGADGRQVLRYVLLPMLLPTMALVTVLLTIGAFQVYVPVALITGGGPLHRTEVVVSYLYNTAFQDLRFGYSAAQAYILASIVFVIGRLQLRLSRGSGDPVRP